MISRIRVAQSHSQNLNLWHTLNPACKYAETATTYFESQEDWGFSDILSNKDILMASSGWLVDDCLTIKTDVVVRPPTGEWYDSKAETGYVGLKNQGATCYLNSWLQTLFHINFFRKVGFPSDGMWRKIKDFSFFFKLLLRTSLNLPHVYLSYVPLHPFAALAASVSNIKTFRHYPNSVPQRKVGDPVSLSVYYF